MGTRIAIFISVAMLTACHGGKPSASAGKENNETEEQTSVQTESDSKTPIYDTTDAQAFGLNGHVRQAVTQGFVTYEEDGELKEGGLYYSNTIIFDAYGHILQDEWGNEYAYDAEGNYYRGNHTYTTITRDKSGRLLKYIDEEPNIDSEENQVLTFSYDKKGRISTVMQGGWTGHWSEQREYQNENKYPSKTEMTSDSEGEDGEYRTVISYRYSNFDDEGNWTERICVSSGTKTIYDTDSVFGQRTIVNETIFIEKRSISYE